MNNDYNGDARRILDFNRCSIICSTEFEIVNVYQTILSNFEIVRVKNRFAHPLFVGTRDCIINIKVKGFICEIQLHYSEFLKLKKMQHITYDVFMGKQPDNLRKMERFCGGWWRRGGVEDFVVEGLGERDFERVKALADFSEKEVRM